MIIIGEHLELSGFRLDRKIFNNSPDYTRASIEFYKTFIAFWSKALKFSKRNQAANMARQIWPGYDNVFKELETRMKRHSRAVLDCAAAVDRERTHIERLKTDAERKKVETERTGMLSTQ